MRSNPYGAHGPCQTCTRAPATSICECAGKTAQLCNRCTSAWWDRVNAWLASRGIHMIGAA